MNDEQFQAWLDQHGGEVGRKDNERDAEDGTMNPNTGAPNKKRVVDTTTITAKDGATLTIRRNASGSGPTYSVIENTAPKPATAPAAGQKPAGGREGPEGTPDPNSPTGFDNTRPRWVVRDANGNEVWARPLEPAERQQWERDKNGGKTDAEMSTPPKEEVNPSDPTRLRKPDGKGGWVDAGPNAAGVQAAADRNKPTTSIRENPDGTVSAVQTFPDGRPPVVTVIPGVRGKPDTVKGPDGVTYERGPDGTYKPAAGIPTPGAAAKNVDEFVPDYTQPDLGLGKWAASQRQKIGKPSEAGGITQKDYDAAVTSAHQQAQVTIQNVTSNQQVVRQRDLDQQNERKNLSDQSAADYGKAQSTFNDLWKYTKPGSRAIMDVIPGVMEEQKRYRAEREGTATGQSPLHPMFTSLATAAGVKTPPPVSDLGAQAAAATQTTNDQITRLTQPPAASPAAAGPLAGPQAAAAQAAAAQAASVAAGPPATSMDASDPAQQGRPNIIPPTPVMPSGQTLAPGAPPPTDQNGAPTVFSPSLASGIPGNPDYQPGYPPNSGIVPDPNAPQAVPVPEPVAPAAQDPDPLVTKRKGSTVQTMRRSEWEQKARINSFYAYGWEDEQLPVDVPYPTSPGAYSQMAPQQPGPLTAWAQQATAPQPPQPPAVPMNPALQQAAQQPPAWNPYETGGKLAAWGVPPEAVAQAMRELGMT